MIPQSFTWRAMAAFGLPQAEVGAFLRNDTTNRSLRIDHIKVSPVIPYASDYHAVAPSVAISRITAIASAGVNVPWVKADTNSSDLSALVCACIAPSVTLGSDIRRIIPIPCNTNTGTVGGFLSTKKARLPSWEARKPTSAQAIVLREGQGVGVRLTNAVPAGVSLGIGPPCQLSIEVTVRVSGGSTTYTALSQGVVFFDESTPGFAVLNQTGSGVTIEVLRIDVFDVVASLSSNTALDPIALRFNVVDGVITLNNQNLEHNDIGSADGGAITRMFGNIPISHPALTSIVAHDSSNTLPSGITGYSGPARLAPVGRRGLQPPHCWGNNSSMSTVIQITAGLIARCSAPSPFSARAVAMSGLFAEHLLPKSQRVFDETIGTAAKAEIPPESVLTVATGGYRPPLVPFGFRDSAFWSADPVPTRVDIFEIEVGFTVVPFSKGGPGGDAI